MSENCVDIRKLSPYIRHKVEQKDYELAPPNFILTPVTSIHNKINNACHYVETKYNNTKYHLIDERGFQRISYVLGLSVATSILGRNLPKSLTISKLNNFQLRRLSPLYTTVGFTSAMYYNYPDVTKNSFNASRAFLSGRYQQYKVNKELKRIEAEKEAAIAAIKAKKRAEVERVEQEKKEAEEKIRQEEAKRQAEIEKAAAEAEAAAKEELTLETFGEDPGQSSKEDEDLYTTRQKNEL